MKKYNKPPIPCILLATVLITTVAFIAGACGGGGSGGGSSSAAPSVSAPASTPAPTPAPTPTPAPVTNVLAVTVDPGPANSINEPFASVTVCAPGTNNCQTIDHILVDTGSNGLRIFSSVLSSSIPLTQQAASNGTSLVECTQFSDGFAWGPVKAADIKIAGEQASSVAIQIIGDPRFSTVPSDCSSTGPSLDTVQSFGSNGVLGVGLFLQDCGPACAQSTAPGVYYGCSASTCLSTMVGLRQQVLNPVALFTVNNNGVILKLPSIPEAGAVTVNGSLIFGIGTQTNNGLGSAKILTTNTSGNISVVFNSKTYSESFIDSGSNGIFFPDGRTATCSGFYCPTSTQTFSAINQGANGVTTPVSFLVANADTLLNTNFAAFSTLGGTNPNANSFDWGLPFFFGRNVYTAIEGKSTTGGTGPYFAY